MYDFEYVLYNSIPYYFFDDFYMQFVSLFMLYILC